MYVPLWIWIVTVLVVVGFFVFDFFSHVRNAHEPSVKESTVWSLFYIGLAVVMMVGIGLMWDWDHAMQFIAGYTTEKALSVDNLFVFLIIMTSFKVPKIAQQKALLIGIAIALVMRMLFIIGGAAILEAWSWVFYLFGAWLLFVAIRQAVESFKDDEPEMPSWVNLVRKVIHTSDDYDGDRWTIVKDGRKALTPLVLVIVALGFTDLLFALDSIPAIFGITQEPYLVFLANAVALMGLRQLYFLIGALLEKLVFLDLGLAFILGFIAVKLFFHAMHVNELSFINGGQPIEWAPEIPIWFSLTFIFGVLAIATIASLIYSSGKDDEADGEEPDAVEAEGDEADAVQADADRTELDRAAPSAGAHVADAVPASETGSGHRPARR
ncbi:putative membrane protein [Pseudoclavibacter triregionum]|nr:putative membrane protein [Pseudoclavibacter triregionum]